MTSKHLEMTHEYLTWGASPLFVTWTPDLRTRWPMASWTSVPTTLKPAAYHVDLGTAHDRAGMPHGDGPGMVDIAPMDGFHRVLPWGEYMGELGIDSHLIENPRCSTSIILIFYLFPLHFFNFNVS